MCPFMKCGILSAECGIKNSIASELAKSPLRTCFVLGAGIEPARAVKARRILSPVRLPVPPSELPVLRPERRGDEQIRTVDGAFAELCLTTWLRRPYQRCAEIK